MGKGMVYNQLSGKTESIPMKTVEIKKSGYIRIKRMFDFVASFLALIILSPVFLIVAILVRIKLGSPVIFTQKRPGLGNRIVTYHKFRSMTNAKDENGKLLPDNIRLTKFGKILRSTSLDELPQLWDILTGRMSLIGPRPHLVKDMLFYTDEQLERQSVMPGLTGWAQINGRNSITWDEKLSLDLYYVENISFAFDVKIFFKTIAYVLKREGINETDSADTESVETHENLGEMLLRTGRISREEYEFRLREAEQLLTGGGYCLTLQSDKPSGCGILAA